MAMTQDFRIDKGSKWAKEHFLKKCDFKGLPDKIEPQLKHKITEQSAFKCLPTDM